MCIFPDQEEDDRLRGAPGAVCGLRERRYCGVPVGRQGQLLLH